MNLIVGMIFYTNLWILITLPRLLLEKMIIESILSISVKLNLWVQWRMPTLMKKGGDYKKEKSSFLPYYYDEKHIVN